MRELTESFIVACIPERLVPQGQWRVEVHPHHHPIKHQRSAPLSQTIHLTCVRLSYLAFAAFKNLHHHSLPHQSRPRQTRHRALPFGRRTPMPCR